MKEEWWILIYPWHVIYQFSVFFPNLTKTMKITKIHFGHFVGKYGPWYCISPSFVPGSVRCSSECLFSIKVLKICVSLFSLGVNDLTKDTLTEHPDTINILERMNIYQEVILAAAYRFLGIKVGL